MLDEYEIRLSQANKKFDAVREANSAERRGVQRRNESSTRRRLLERRQNTDVHVEIERRKKERRSLDERRNFEERRVTSDYSQQRLEEERDRLKTGLDSDRAFASFTLIFFLLLFGIIYYIFIKP